MFARVITDNGTKEVDQLSENDLIRFNQDSTDDIPDIPERTMLTVSQQDGNAATVDFEVGLKIELKNGNTVRVGLDGQDDLDNPIDVTDTDGGGEITPEEAAIQIASRVDGHANLSTDQSDNNGDGAFVNIEEDDEDGQSADVVIKDTDGNHVDITLIKLKFTDSVGNRFEQRTQIDNTTLVEKYNSDGDPLGTDSIDVDNRVLRVGSDDGDADVIPEESDSLDIATPKQADWMDDDNGGLEQLGDSNFKAGTIEERTLMRTLGDNDNATIDSFFVNSFSEGALGASFRESHSFDADVDGIPNFLNVSDETFMTDHKGFYVISHEIGHLIKDSGHVLGIERVMVSSSQIESDLSTEQIRIDLMKRFTGGEWSRMIQESAGNQNIVILKPIQN